MNCEDNTDSSATGEATGTDNCTIPTITQSDVSTQDLDVSNVGHYNYTITRTWTCNGCIWELNSTSKTQVSYGAGCHCSNSNCSGYYCYLR